MHEIPLCQRALELIEQQAAKHGAKRVTGVWLKIGAFSCVETSSLAFCFDLVCRGSVAEGCKLHLEEQEAECWCETCQQYVTLPSASAAVHSVMVTCCRLWQTTVYRFGG